MRHGDLHPFHVRLLLPRQLIADHLLELVDRGVAVEAEDDALAIAIIAPHALIRIVDRDLVKNGSLVERTVRDESVHAILF